MLKDLRGEIFVMSLMTDSEGYGKRYTSTEFQNDPVDIQGYYAVVRNGLVAAIAGLTGRESVVIMSSKCKLLKTQ